MSLPPPSREKLRQLTQEYHRLQTLADNEFTSCEQIYQNLAHISDDEKADKLLEARGHLGRASDNLQDSLTLRHQAYHHRTVDAGHQHFEQRLQRWIMKNRELDRQLGREHVEFGSVEKENKRQQTWLQFVRQREELKALENEMRAQDEHRLPVLGPHGLLGGTAQWNKVASREVDGEQADSVGMAIEQREPISFQLPPRQVVYQRPVLQAFADETQADPKVPTYQRPYKPPTADPEYDY